MFQDGGGTWVAAINAIRHAQKNNGVGLPAGASAGFIFLGTLLLGYSLAVSDGAAQVKGFDLTEATAPFAPQNDRAKSTIEAHTTVKTRKPSSHPSQRLRRTPRAAVPNPTAGAFGWPFSPYSSFNRNAQYFLQWNSGFKKYHLADDWNGNGGGSTDLGQSLYAIADGVVQYRDDTSAISSYGKSLIIRHTLPNATKVDSVFLHLKKISAGPVGTPVYKGNEVATLGDANGFYAGAAHLHWEQRRDLSITDTTVATKQNFNPYANPLTISTALRFTSPSLFVDDRQIEYRNALSYRNWTYFPWYFNAPSSTAYVEYNGEKYSLKRATDAGLIYGYVYEQRSGQWYSYSDINNVFFGAGNTYAIYSWVPGANVVIFVPGNRYRADRARQDMIKAASRDRRFTNVLTETYGEMLTWDPNFELRYMAFGFSGGTTYFNQAVSKSNPLERYTIFRDPSTGQWSSWTAVNRNVLD